MRIYLDPKMLNKASKWERYLMQTPNSIQTHLNDKNIFTVIDMKDGYWHVKPTEKASHYCTFNTQWGRMGFHSMPFGILSAAEVMQKRNTEAFSDIQGVQVIAGDLIIAAASVEEHDQIMRRVLERARELKVKFNKFKIQFKVSEVLYMGNVVTVDGIRQSKGGGNH